MKLCANAEEEERDEVRQGREVVAAGADRVLTRTARILDALLVG